MKTITILRHAKAAPYGDYSVDFQRPLAGRGPKDAARMADLLATLDPAPDWIISSPALRARQTAEVVAQRLDLAQAMSWNESIYDASAQTLLEVLRVAPEKADHVVLVGHNPGMETLVAGLCAGSTNGAMIYLPTAGVAHLQSQIFYWHQLRWGSAQMTLLASPRSIKTLTKQVTSSAQAAKQPGTKKKSGKKKSGKRADKKSDTGTAAL